MEQENNQPTQPTEKQKFTGILIFLIALVLIGFGAYYFKLTEPLKNLLSTNDTNLNNTMYTEPQIVRVGTNESMRINLVVNNFDNNLTESIVNIEYKPVFLTLEGFDNKSEYFDVDFDKETSTLTISNKSRLSERLNEHIVGQIIFNTNQTGGYSEIKISTDSNKINIEQQTSSTGVEIEDSGLYQNQEPTENDNEGISEPESNNIDSKPT